MRGLLHFLLLFIIDHRQLFQRTHLLLLTLRRVNCSRWRINLMQRFISVFFNSGPPSGREIAPFGVFAGGLGAWEEVVLPLFLLGFEG